MFPVNHRYLLVYHRQTLVQTRDLEVKPDPILLFKSVSVPAFEAPTPQKAN